MAFKGTCKTLAKVADDEPIFVLRAQDMLAANIVKCWCEDAEENGVDEEKIAEARRCYHAMLAWKNRKIPD